MKAKFLLLSAVLGGMALYGCDSDDNNNVKMPETHQTAFKAMYPDAKKISWEKKGEYFVAEFYRTDKKAEAESWFNQSAEWKMTVTEFENRSMLPQAVLNTLQASVYADWRIDDIKMVERANMELIYVVEVEKNKEEYDLYFSASGTMIKAVADKDENDGNKFIPGQATKKLTDLIKEMYPHAKILDIDYEHSTIEIEIIDGSTFREVVLTSEGVWRHTKTEVTLKDVPQNVVDALKNSKYGTYKIDDIDFYDTPEKDYYIFELDVEPKDIEVKIFADGTIADEEQAV